MEPVTQETRDSMAEQETQTDAVPTVSDAEVERILHNHVMTAMGIGLVPVPLIDFVAVSSVQLNLVRRLAAIYKVPFFKNMFHNVASVLIGGGLPVTSARAASSFVKTIPVVGHAVGAVTMPVLAGASTYAIGKVFIQHFASGGTFLTFKPHNVKAYYQEMFEEGQRLAATLKQDQS